MKRRNRIWTSALAFLLGLTCTFSINQSVVKADEFWPEGPQTGSGSVVVMEMNTGTVLYEKNGHDVHYPASITKIMTTMLALEHCSMDEIVTFSADAVFKNEGNTSHIARDLNEQMTMEQCLYAVMLESANECAYAVAEHVGTKLGGDYRTFIDLMNQRAEELGCLNTHFNNANGLPDDQHWTSAYDMALIAQAAYENEDFRIITGTGSYKIPPTNKHVDETPCHNHHKMLYPYQTSRYLYDYCTGGKTGYTNAARNTLVTFAEKDGMSLVCVVMYAEMPAHWTDTRTLLDYYFDNFQVLSITEHDAQFQAQSTKDTGLLNENDSFVTLDKNAYIILPKTASFSDAVYQLDTNNKNSNSVGTLTYTYAGHQVGCVDVIASQAEVKEPEFQNQKENQHSGADVVKIKPIWILLGFGMILVVIGLIWIVKKILDNIYLVRYRIISKREQKDRFRDMKRRKSKKRRRRDSIFTIKGQKRQK